MCFEASDHFINLFKKTARWNKRLNITLVRLTNEILDNPNIGKTVSDLRSSPDVEDRLVARALSFVPGVEDSDLVHKDTVQRPGNLRPIWIAMIWYDLNDEGVPRLWLPGGVLREPRIF